MQVTQEQIRGLRHTPRKGKKLLKILAIIVGILFILIIIGYNYLTSAHFVRHFVFPAIGKDINRNLSADQITIKPFSRVVLTNFKLTNPNKPEEPALLSFNRLAVHYKLFSIIKGEPVVESLELIEPQLNVVGYADGTSNLDDLISKKPEVEKPARKKKAKEKPAELPEFNIVKVEVNQGRLRFIALDKQGKPAQELTFDKINFSLADFRPDKETKLAFSVNIGMKDAAELTDLTDGRFSLETRLLVAQNLSRINVDGSLSLTGLKGKLRGNPVAGYTIESQINLNKENALLELAPFSLAFKRNEQIGGQITATGKYDNRTGEGKFNFQIEDINRTLLNLVGSQAGDIDFRDTSINYQCALAISDSGKKLDVGGLFDIKKFSILAPQVSEAPTEEIDVSLRHLAHIDSEKQTLEIANLDLEAFQNGQEFASGKLDDKLIIDFTMARKAGAEAPAINYIFNIKDFDLAQLQAILPTPEGIRLNTARLNADLKTLFARNGKIITVKGNVGVNNLSGTLADAQIPSTDVTLQINTAIDDFSRIKLHNLDFLMEQKLVGKNQFSLSGEADIQAGNANLNLDLASIDLMTIRDFLPKDMAELERGKFQGAINLALAQNFSVIETKGEVGLYAFTAKIKDNMVNNFSLIANFDTSINKSKEVGIRQVQLDFRPQDKPAGNVQLSGNLNLETGNGALQVAVEDVNESLINSVAENILQDMELASLKFDYSSQVDLKNKFTDLSTAGEFTLQNLNLRNRKLNETLIPPLDLTLKHDVSMKGEEINLKTINIGFKPARQLALWSEIPSFGIALSHPEDIPGEVRGRPDQVGTGIHSRGGPAAGPQPNSSSDVEASGSIDLKGKMNLKAGEGDIHLAIRNLNESLLNAVAAKSLGDKRLASISINSTNDLKLANRFQNIIAVGAFSVENLKMIDRKTREDVIPSMDLDLKHDVQLSENQILVKDVTLNVSPKDRPKETLVIKGEIFRQKGKKSNFKLLADRISVDNYLPLIPAPPEEKEAKKEEKTPSPPKELEPLDLTDIELDGTVDIKALTYKKVSITDLMLNTSVADNVIDLKNLNMKINNAGFDTQARLKVDVPGWQYSVKTNLGKLDIVPIVDSFAPQLQEKLAGMATFAINIKGQGTLPQNLQQHLKGQITGDLVDGKLYGIPILTALSEVTRIPELEELRFFKGIVDLNIDQGKININNLDFQGKIERLGVRGWLGLDERIDLLLQVALAPPLNKKLKELKYVGELLTDAQGYTELPVPVGMTGTFSKPKPSLELKPAIKETGKKLLEDLLRRELEKQKEKEEKKKQQ